MNNAETAETESELEEGQEQAEQLPEEPEAETAPQVISPEEQQKRSQAIQESQKLNEASFHQANPDAFDLARSAVSKTESLEERAKSYEQVIQNKEYIDKERASEIAKDLAKLEEAFINDDLRKELKASFGEDEVNTERAINDIKGSLFEIVLSGQMTADQLISTANLGIHVGEVGQGHIAKIVNNSEGAAIILSKQYLKENDDRKKAHFLAHEFGHGITEKRAFWSHQQLDLLKAACFDDFKGDTSKLAPELQMVLNIVKDPENAFLITNKYIAERLNGIGSASDIGQERFNVAKEILAEMLTSYLLDGSTLSHYLANRMKCLDEAGWARLKSQAEKKGITLDEGMSPVEKILALNEQGFFGEEFKAYEHFAKKIGRRNENFEVNEKNPYLEQPYELYDDESLYGAMGGYGDEHWSQTGGGTDKKTPFDKLFDLFKIPTKEINFNILGGGSKAGLPKAA